MTYSELPVEPQATKHRRREHRGSPKKPKLINSLGFFHWPAGFVLVPPARLAIANVTAE